MCLEVGHFRSWPRRKVNGRALLPARGRRTGEASKLTSFRPRVCCMVNFKLLPAVTVSWVRIMICWRLRLHCKRGGCTRRQRLGLGNWCRKSLLLWALIRMSYTDPEDVKALFRMARHGRDREGWEEGVPGQGERGRHGRRKNLRVRVKATGGPFESSRKRSTWIGNTTWPMRTMILIR